MRFSKIFLKNWFTTHSGKQTKHNLEKEKGEKRFRDQSQLLSSKKLNANWHKPQIKRQRGLQAQLDPGLPAMSWRQSLSICLEGSVIWWRMTFGSSRQTYPPSSATQLTGHVTLPRNPTNTRGGLGHAAHLPLSHIGLVKANQSSIRREEEGDRYQVDSYQVHDSIPNRMNSCCNKGPEAGPLMLLQETVRTEPILLVD